MPNRAAFLASLVIFVAGAIPLAGQLAARGGSANRPLVYDLALPDAPAPMPLDVPAAQKPTEVRAAGRAVCVRLCDGFFFPSATSSDNDGACQKQCPDSPTVRYTEAAGSDRIEEAVSLRGAPYTALAASGRYRATRELSCSCHRSAVRGYSDAVLNDPTLRKGDVVVTPKGFLVFQGAKGGANTSADFVALSEANSAPKEQRAALIALEGRGPPQEAGAANVPAGALVSRSEVSLAPTSVAGSQ
jgi:hypothetical protein